MDQLTKLLRYALTQDVSDIIFVADAPPMFRVDGKLLPADNSHYTPEQLDQLLRPALDEKQYQKLQAEKDIDFSLNLPGLGRFRFNIHYQKESLAAAIRVIPSNIPDLPAMQLPDMVAEFSRLHHGLVLVTGQTGSGKSTTLAAMINYINTQQAKHIITLEDPVEFAHTHGKSIVEQREVGLDCPSFASGLRHVLRQDPDVILVGELRDLETIRIALQAAETGHLVLGTLHSSTAAGAVDRMIEVFPAEEQSQIRTHLAECLKGVITQQLLPSAKGNGRVVAAEILVATRAICNNIREGTPHLIPGVISTGRKFGMQTMEQAVHDLVMQGRIAPDSAGHFLDGQPATEPSQHNQGYRQQSSFQELTDEPLSSMSSMSALKY